MDRSRTPSCVFLLDTREVVDLDALLVKCHGLLVMWRLSMILALLASIYCGYDSILDRDNDSMVG